MVDIPIMSVILHRIGRLDLTKTPLFCSARKDREQETVMFGVFKKKYIKQIFKNTYISANGVTFFILFSLHLIAKEKEKIKILPQATVAFIYRFLYFFFIYLLFQKQNCTVSTFFLNSLCFLVITIYKGALAGRSINEQTASETSFHHTL